VRHLDCFPLLNGHHVTIYHDTLKDTDLLAARFQDAEPWCSSGSAPGSARRCWLVFPSCNSLLKRAKGSRTLMSRPAPGMALRSASDGFPICPGRTHLGADSRGHASPSPGSRTDEGRSLARHAGAWPAWSQLGIFGYGKIGSLVAGYGRALACGYRVGREHSLTQAQADGFETAARKKHFSETLMCSASI